MATNTSAEVRGINVAGIPKIKTAITDWKNAVIAAKLTETSKKVTSSLKGSNQQLQIKKICQAVDSYSASLIKKLDDYVKRLDEVQAAYQKNDLSSTAYSGMVSGVSSFVKKS